MQVKKRLIVAGVVASVGLASAGGIGVVSAAAAPGDDSLASTIAQKLNLKENDVKAVLGEEHTQREAKKTQRMSEDLQVLVDGGKITAAQKTLIETKMTELHTADETEQTALHDWATQQGINEMYLKMALNPDDSTALQTLLDQGKITAAQKTAIEAKRDEIRQARDTAHTALVKWASDNGIDLQYIPMFAGAHGDKKPGHELLENKQ